MKNHDDIRAVLRYMRDQSTAQGLSPLSTEYVARMLIAIANGERDDLLEELVMDEIKRKSRKIN